MVIHRGARVLQNVSQATLGGAGTVTSAPTNLATVTLSNPAAVTAAQSIAGAAGLQDAVIETTITVVNSPSPPQTYFVFTSACAPPITIVTDSYGVIEYST